MAGIRLVVGFDFGTSTTKVIVRERPGRTDPVVLSIGPPPAGRAPYFCPSLVRERGGRLWFGAAAEEVDGGTLHRSLKGRLLPTALEILNPTWTAAPSGVPADVLAAAYLGWAFSETRGRLDDRFGRGEYRMTLNVGVPMNHADSDVARERFLHVVQAGWKANFGDSPLPIPQGCNLPLVRPVLEKWLEEPILEKEHRPFDVLPEAIAPIVSMVGDPDVGDGIYLVVDIGGSTTECASLDSSKAQGVVAYAVSSARVGGDDLDSMATDRANGRTGVADHFEELARGRLMRVIGGTWQMGRTKVNGTPMADFWDSTTLLLTGGGAFREKYREWIGEIRLREREPNITWYAPQALRNSVSRNYGGSGRSVPVLVVADGLSYHRMEWPEWLPPCAVGAMPRDPGPEPIDPTWYQERA